VSDEHYFTADPSVAFSRKPVRAHVWGHDLSLTSGSGVFAQGRVDIGTSVLFREAEPQAQDGPFLDLGCGYGVIATALAVVRPGAEVWAVDVNERALLLTRENAESQGARVHAVRPEDVPADLRFTEIWSNPPIRVGKQALHDLLLTWLPRLAPGGRAVLVVGRNLGADSLHRWLEEQGFPTTRVGSAKGFRVLEVRPRG
jgi:16S rRNA G1207 methylase RsmC